MDADFEPVVRGSDVPEEDAFDGHEWGHAYRVLTPHAARPGHLGLGASLNRVPPGRAAVPFHHHALDDELFYVLEGRGVLRYGDSIHEIRPGDCISCPAGTDTAHQIANPFEEGDLVYLAVGRNDRNEVCVYPDSGKVLVRAVNTIGRLERTGYTDGEPESPRVFDLARSVEGIQVR